MKSDFCTDMHTIPREILNAMQNSMTQRRTFMAVGFVLLLSITILMAAAVKCCPYYFAPAEILDSKHVGLIYFRHDNAYGISVGTTSSSVPGEIVCQGSIFTNNVFLFRGVGPWDNGYTFRCRLARKTFSVKCDAVDSSMDYSRNYSLCIWPPFIIRSYVLLSHNAPPRVSIIGESARAIPDTGVE